MKPVFRILVLAVLAVSLLAAPAAMAAELPSGVSGEDVGAQIEAYVAENRETTAAMTVAVFDRDGNIYRNWFGYADVENGIPADAETVMEWGSVTKLLTWVSVIQLWEQGKLDLEADIRSYLPQGFLKNLRYETPVTMLHLMNHNAGFEDTYIGMMSPNREGFLSLEAYLQIVQPRQIFEPGSITAYSNWSTALAGYIVQCVSGMEFSEYVGKHIFEPLGMKHSAVRPDLSDNPWVDSQRQLLECYDTSVGHIPNCRHYFAIYPAGSCTSTLEDLELFAAALLDPNSPLFADTETYAYFLSPSSYYGDTEYPLNYHGLWDQSRYDGAVLGHGGNTMGCSAQLLLNLEAGVGMVVMTNQASEWTYTMEMPKLIFGAYSGEVLDYTGYLEGSRTMFTGPLKLYQVAGIVTVREPFEFRAVRSDLAGIDRVTASYEEARVTTLPKLLLKFSPLILWVAALIYCAVSLVVQGIAVIRRRFRQNRRKIPLQGWAAGAKLVQLLPVIAIVGVISTLITGNQWAIWQYRAVFALMLALVIIFALMLIRGLWAMRKRSARRFDTAAVIISLAISMFNLVYWQLCCFWMI